MSRQYEQEGPATAVGGSVDRWLARATFWQKAKLFGAVFLVLAAVAGNQVGHGPRETWAWFNGPSNKEALTQIHELKAVVGTVAENQVILSENQQEVSGAVSELHGYPDALRRYNIKKDQERARPRPLAPVPDLSESQPGYVPNFPNVYDLTRR